MILWSTHYRVFAPFDAFPVLQHIQSERHRNPAYHHEGRYRANETHCIFKYTLSGTGIFRDGRGEHRVTAGTGFLCRIGDPQTAYYYPKDSGEPWDFVFASFAGGHCDEMVNTLVDRFGPLFTLDPESEAIMNIMHQRRRRVTEVELLPGKS
ncbi:MAG: AraC family ligand binding domain-containing protein, partial [Planctomycetota bacterium]